MSIRQALRLTLLGGAAACMAAGGGAQAAEVSLDEALAAARDNLDLRIAAHGVDAARADIAAADHAPLPQLSAKLSQIDLQNGIGPGSLLGGKRIDKGVGLDWTWERGGKRGLRTEAARHGAGAAEADRDELRLQQLLATQAAFFDLLAAQGRREQLQAIEGSARQTLDIARRRMNAGDAALQDAARAEVEAERAAADTLSAQLDLQRAQFVLAQLTGRGDAATLQAHGDWPADDAGSEATALEARVAQRADVHAAEERVRAAEAALAGASALRQGDVTWGASFDHYPGTSTRQVELRLSMPLAFGYHYDGEAERARAQLGQAQDQLEKVRALALIELQRLAAERTAAARRAQRYDGDIVPRSREVAARAELAYGKGALSLTELLDARRTLRAVLLDALAAHADLAKASGAWRLRNGA